MIEEFFDQGTGIANGLAVLLSFVGGEEGGGFIILMLLLVCGLYVVGVRRRDFRNMLANAMTSLGILGTFCGIFIALQGLNFRPGEIEDDVSSLVRGMRVAFVTSLIGIGATLLSRLTWGPVSRLVARLRGLHDQKKATPPSPDQNIVERLDAIKNAIAGDGDSSMVTQMQKMRDENRNGFEKLDGLSETIRVSLVDNLSNLIKTIQEDVAKKLVDSVGGLADEIRRAFSEQLGKAFEDFNAAMQAIKKWQEDHRQHVEQLTEAFEKSAQGIERIRADCESIPKTMGDLRVMVEAANVQQKELAEHLRVFAEMKTKAEESFPAIKANLDKVGDDLAASAKSFDGLAEKIQEAFRLAQTETQRVAEQHAANVEKMAANMREKMEQAQRDAADGIRKSVSESTQQMTSEIDRVAKLWGDNLVSIAQECAKMIEQVREQARR